MLLLAKPSAVDLLIKSTPISMLEIIEDHDESLFKRMRDSSHCLHNLLPLVRANTLGRLRPRGPPYTLPQINFKQHKLPFPTRCLFNNMYFTHSMHQCSFFGVNSFITLTYNFTFILLCVCNLATFLLFSCNKFLLLYYSRVCIYCHFYDLWHLF